METKAALKRLASPVFEAFAKSVDRQFIYLCDVKANMWRWSGHAVKYFGLPGEYVQDLPKIWMDLVHPDDRAGLSAAFGRLFSGEEDEHSCEYRVKNAAGEYVWVLCRGCLVRDGEGRQGLCAGILTNLGAVSKFDPVTALYSHHTFLSDLQAALDGARGGGVLLLGIDYFKRINGMHGRAFGTALLRSFAVELQRAMPSEVAVYRMAGDQFALLCREAERAALEAYFQQAAEIGTSGLLVEGRSVRFTVSGGAVLYPEDAEKADEVYRDLEYALERSKKNAREGLTFFTSVAYEETLRRFILRQKLRESVRDRCRGFFLCYQPLVSADRKELTGAEALLRWADPEAPPVSPTEFVPLLEQSGDINIVGRWVLSTALTQMKKWRETLPDLKVSVNVSYLQMQDDSFVDFVLDELERQAFPKNRLVLEMTESLNVTDPVRLNKKLCRFREKGIQIALDDFGTGYASLSILRDLSADWIKVDHTFVAQIVNSNFDQALMEHLIMLCRKLGLNICVEGIETEEIQNTIQRYQPTTLQGFYYSRPVVTQEFEARFIRKKEA